MEVRGLYYPQRHSGETRQGPGWGEVEVNGQTQDTVTGGHDPGRTKYPSGRPVLRVSSGVLMSQVDKPPTFWNLFSEPKRRRAKGVNTLSPVLGIDRVSREHYVFT